MAKRRYRVDVLTTGKSFVVVGDEALDWAIAKYGIDNLRITEIR